MGRKNVARAVTICEFGEIVMSLARCACSRRPHRSRLGIFRPMNELVDRNLARSPARPLFPRRPRTLRYCCLSWGGAKASRNTLLRNGDKRRSHPRALVLIEARRRLLYPEPICAPKETYSSAVVRLFKIAYHGTGRTIIARTLLVRSLTLPSARKSPILFRHRSSGRSSHCPAGSISIPPTWKLPDVRGAADHLFRAPPALPRWCNAVRHACAPWSAVSMPHVTRVM